MYKKIILTLFLSNIIFSGCYSAESNDDLNQNGKRLISHDDNSTYKINTSSKDILINQISDDVLDPNDFESMDVFFKTIEKLLLDIDYAQDLQKIILNLSDNFLFDLDVRLKTAELLRNSNFRDFLTNEYTHKKASFEAYAKIASTLHAGHSTEGFLNEDVNVLIDIINILLNVEPFYTYYSYNALKSIAEAKKDLGFGSLNYIAEIDFEEFRSILNLMQNTGKNLNNKLLVSVRNVKKEAREKILNAAIKISNSNWSIQDYCTIIDRLKMIDANEDLNAAANLFYTHFVQKMYSADESLNILEYILGVVEKDRKKVVEIIVGFSENDWSASDFCNYIHIFKFVDSVVDTPLKIEILNKFIHIKKFKKENYTDFIILYFKIYANSIKNLSDLDFFINIAKNFDDQNTWSISDYVSFVSAASFKDIQKLKEVTDDEKIVDFTKYLANSLVENHINNKCMKRPISYNGKNSIMIFNYGHQGLMFIECLGKFLRIEKEDCFDILTHIINFASKIKWDYKTFGVFCDLLENTDKRHIVVDCLNKFENFCPKKLKAVSYILSTYKDNQDDYIDFFINYYDKLKRTNTSDDFAYENFFIDFLSLFPENIHETIINLNIDDVCLEDFSIYENDGNSEEIYEYCYARYFLSQYYNYFRNDIIVNKKILKHWENILNSKDKDLSKMLVHFIESRFCDLDADKDRELIQMLIRCANKLVKFEGLCCLDGFLKILNQFKENSNLYINFYIKYCNVCANEIDSNEKQCVDNKNSYKSAFFMVFSCFQKDIHEEIMHFNIENFFNAAMDTEKISFFVYFMRFCFNCLKHNEIKKEKIFNHWKSILNTDNEKLVKFLIEFITYEDLGIDEDHELIQLCITIQTLLDQSNDPKNPFKVYRDLKNKRQEEVDFSNLISFQFFTDDKSKDAINYKIALNPDFFKKLSEIEVDFDSVPHVDPMILDLALNVIETRIFNNEILLHEVYSIIEPSLLNEAQPSLDRMKSSFNEMKLKVLSGDRYLFSLLNADREHKVAAQFKCLMKHIISLDATDGSDKELSTQEQALLKTLSSITNCSTGQAGGIVEAYAYLPYEAKLKTKSGHQLEVATIGQDQLPSFVASEFLYDTFQDIIETMFSGTNDLMIDICGEVKIEEPVHQGLYLRNLIGDLVGARHGLKFDRHAQLYYTNLLALTRQQAIEVFYKYANRDLKGLISFTRAKINDVVNTDRSILNGLVELLKGQNDENTWLSDEADKLSITDEGVVKLLIRIDALKQDAKLF